MDYKKIKNLNVYSEEFLKRRGEKLILKREKSKEKANKVIEDLRLHRNWSWYEELWFRNRNNLTDIALFYRGTEISYLEMFYKISEYAKALRALGVEKGNKIPVCMSNAPEFVYLLGAISMTGAVANIFSADFEPDYVDEIIKSCNSKFIFIEDNEYLKISQNLKNLNLDKIIMTSLSDSLNENYELYKEYDKKYSERFRNKVNGLKEQDDRICNIDEFEELGKKYFGKIKEKTTLDSEFTITYSSGTISNRPKQIVHATKSFNEVTRFHDSEINHTPSYKLFTMQATIPTYSSTGLISGISDALTQGCKLSLEPIYEPEFVVKSLMINRPSYLDFTKSFWLQFAKDILYNPEYENVELPELTICFSVGEPTELNEEKLINKALKKVKAGRKILRVPLPIVKLSIAGGDCEHGGLFYRLFRAYPNLNPIHKIKNEAAGLGTFDMVDLAILDDKGNHCKPYEVGRLVATSDLNMLRYENDHEATEKFKVYDHNGKEYGDCSVDAYQDIFGYYHLKGRKENDNCYEITETILSNKKDVLSCEITKKDDIFIAHIEFQPDSKNTLALYEIDDKCNNILGEEISSRIVYKIYDINNSLPLTHSGKRDKMKLKETEITDGCIKPIYENNEYKIVDAKDYIEKEKTNNKTYKK